MKTSKSPQVPVQTVRNLKRTKIVATAGPATDDPKVLFEMMKSGLSVVRLNASHGTRADLKRRLDLVRATAAQAQEIVALLLDLSGPKIRIEGFANGPIHLEEG
ncbi:MAG TPA: pyruvate kinase, partial [Steroidobacteraceae bacterium]|nr:pyruvate kinase [Steroidobacteraceae bacterium]